MLRELNLRMCLQNIKEGFIGFLISVLNNMVEIANRLVVMNSDNEVDFFHFNLSKNCH